MKLNKLITGAIVAAFVLCILAVMAISLQSQSSDKPGSQEPQSAANGKTVAQSPVQVTASQQPPQDAQLPEVSGLVRDTRGNMLSGITVTLHLMSGNSTDARVSDVREVSQLTTTSNGNGEYRFSSVPRTPGVDYYYVSAQMNLPSGEITHGNGLNLTLEDNSRITSNIVLYLPQ
jgi:hypothetical protein